ncbi:HD domain-containing phosphohydrolase [Psychromonas ossibalaenae]|uniref:HD domain-containing phosphohydrolase n=1 Tax=Psychromonas ossibalaenae TaxID=444922 RepID=UPI0003769105|nr:HD domain-containing phosphohydrolase [Psychromonas ossibalaenae]
MDWLAEEDETDTELVVSTEHCNILIVDDEEDVHATTILTMKRFMFEGKSMRFFSAHSALEAKQILKQERRFSLILLDVVMETENAGLDLAKYIRQDLKNRFTRIILRTGQPGVAPEHSVIRDFDIDGYKSKTELRKQDLESSFYTSLRAYRDICQLQKHREILEQVIDSIANISQIGDLLNFAAAVLAQIELVLNLSTTKMLIESSETFAISQMEDRLNMFSANANVVHVLEHSDINHLPDHERDLFLKALKVKHNFHEGRYYVYYHHSDRGYDTIFAFETKQPLENAEIRMIDLFLRNVLLSYENLLLVNAFEETQELAITLMGGTMESHSKETGAHVVRVGLYAMHLAKLNGETAYFCERIRLAAQLHDVGKVGVPDSILKKEDKFTAQEWAEMQLHVNKGWDILQGLDNSIIKMASNLVVDHHEKWDGSGYPNGKKQLEISLEGRITAIADVFDALCSKRCYKDPWTLEQARQEILNGSGKHFDPQLTTLFIDNFSVFSEIYQQNPD